MKTSLKNSTNEPRVGMSADVFFPNAVK